MNQKSNFVFHQNDKCRYFPCHDLEGDFNCKFCYCPLYFLNCDGNFKILNNGIKDCSKCTIPHENYDYIINKLKEEFNESN